MPDLEQVGIGALIELRICAWAATVHTVQVECRRPEIGQREWINLYFAEGRRIERRVVVDELAQVGEARGDALVVTARRRRAIDHRVGKGDQTGVVGLEGPKGRKEAAELA